MIVAIDIGNTNIVIAMYRNGVWTNAFRYETKEPQPEFFYEQAFRNILLEWQVTGSEIDHCVISSVVPDVNQVIIETVTSVTGNHQMCIRDRIHI